MNLTKNYARDFIIKYYLILLISGHTVKSKHGLYISTPSLHVYKTHVHINIQILLRLTDNLTNILLFL